MNIRDPQRLRTSYFWPLYGDREEVVFPWFPSRGAHHVREVLGNYQGVLISDGYAAYSRYAKHNDQVVHAQCWSHTRRKFIDAQTAEPQRTAVALDFIGALYARERDLTIASLQGDKKRAYRAQHSAPLVERFRYRGGGSLFSDQALVCTTSGRAFMLPILRQMTQRRRAMNSEKIRAYVELVGIFGIIVSLIFVGIELRNSNVQARAAAFQAIGIATSEFHQTMDDRLNLLYEDGFDEEVLKTWSYPDWLAVDRRLRADLRLFETALLQVDQGLLGEEAIVNLGFAAFGENWLSIPAAACLWPRVSQGPGRVGPQVRAWIENGSPLSERAECPVELSEKRQSYGSNALEN